MRAFTSGQDDGLTQRLACWFAERRAQAAEARELEALKEAGDERVLADCGLAFDDIAHLTNPKAATLLPEMMAKIGVAERSEVQAGLRDIERSCAMCEAWRRCQAALAVGTAEDTWREFCPNAPVFSDIKQSDGLKRGRE